MANFEINIANVTPYGFKPLICTLDLTPLYNFGDDIYFWMRNNTSTDTDNTKTYLGMGSSFVDETLVYGLFGYNPDRIRINNYTVHYPTGASAVIDFIDKNLNPVTAPVTMIVDNVNTTEPYGFKIDNVMLAADPIVIDINITAYEVLSGKSKVGTVKFKIKA